MLSIKHKTSPSLIVETGVRQGEGPDEPPDVPVVPVEDGVDPHDCRPVPVSWGEIVHPVSSRVSFPHTQHCGLHLGVSGQHLAESSFDWLLVHLIVQTVSLDCIRHEALHFGEGFLLSNVEALHFLLLEKVLVHGVSYVEHHNAVLASVEADGDTSRWKLSVALLHRFQSSPNHFTERLVIAVRQQVLYLLVGILSCVRIKRDWT